jgi:hypothetical protein
LAGGEGRLVARSWMLDWGVGGRAECRFGYQGLPAVARTYEDLPRTYQVTGLFEVNYGPDSSRSLPLGPDRSRKVPGPPRTWREGVAAAVAGCRLAKVAGQEEEGQEDENEDEDEGGRRTGVGCLGGVYSRHSVTTIENIG